MSVNDATWSEIRRCYADADEAVAALAARFGVSVGAIRYRARRDGWPRRAPATNPASSRKGSKPKKDAKPKADSPGKRAKKRPLRRRQRALVAKSRGDDGAPTSEEVVGRLYRAIVKKLSNLEKRMAIEKDLNAADSERETRELSTMVRSFEKVTEVAADIAKQRKPKAGERTLNPADAERMRLEIAQRVEALNTQWETEDDPGEPE